MRQLWDHEPNCVSHGGAQMFRGQGLIRTSSSSFRLEPLCTAIVVAMLEVPAFGAIVCVSEFGITTYRPRLMDLFAGYLRSPGTTLVKTYVLALGSLVGKTVDLWKLPVTFAVKYDFEFAAQNRSTSDELWLTGSLRF